MLRALAKALAQGIEATRKMPWLQVFELNNCFSGLRLRGLKRCLSG